MPATNLPYASIAARNVFSVNPPSPSPTSAQIAEPPPKVTLNGIMSIFGQLQALFKVHQPVRGGQAAKDTAYILCEAESQDGVEVLHIDAITGTVRFNNHGVIQDIALPIAPGTPFFVSAKNEPAADYSSTLPQSYPPEFIRARMPDYLGGGANATSDTPTNSSIEQRILMIEAQRAYLKSHNDPAADTLPPTALTPPDAVIPSGNSETYHTPE